MELSVLSMFLRSSFPDSGAVRPRNGSLSDSRKCCCTSYCLVHVFCIGRSSCDRIMDLQDSESKTTRPLRRSARFKPPSFEATPRGPLKRTRRGSENQAPVAAVNGSRDEDKGSEDEESPSKKKRDDTGGAAGGSGDENEMDLSAEDLEEIQDQEMDSELQDSSPPKYQGTVGDLNLFPRVVLEECRRPIHAINEDAELLKSKRVKPPTKGPAASTKSATQIRSLANKHSGGDTEYKRAMEAKPKSTESAPKITSMNDYQKTMKLLARTTVLPRRNHLPPQITSQQLQNNISTSKETVSPKKKKDVTKTTMNKPSPGYCRRFMWALLYVVLLVPLISASFLIYKNIVVHRGSVDRGGRLYKDRSPKMFADQLSRLQERFPSQRSDLWKRAKIHLERHLTTSQPTEPVSIILTAGSRAEKTLYCLAQSLASCFSSAHNASVLHINGMSKARLDSDEVKLDIDSQLKAAFEGNKPAAVIHRFEELPPGSTLIFYRYCDHESAAYKQVFLLFTVLLPQDEVSSDQTLKDVEESVQDYVKEKLVDTENQTSFNEMDINKFGGLWSRISHLILPVVSESDVEQRGCQDQPGFVQEL